MPAVLEHLTPLTLLLVGLIFLLAGWIKGVVGMGLPVVAMAAMSLMMTPAQAAAILILPSLVTNVLQFAAGPAKAAISRRLAPMVLLAALGIFVGIPMLTSSHSVWPPVTFGVVLMVYAALALFAPPFRVPQRHERWLGPIVGSLTGLLAGATGVFAVPLVPYVSSLGLNKDELVQALGLSFTVSTLALALALAGQGHYPAAAAWTSVLALVPALAGMYLGQSVRSRLDAAVFRRWFLVAMACVGLYTALHALLGATK